MLVLNVLFAVFVRNRANFPYATFENEANEISDMMSLIYLYPVQPDATLM